MKSDSKSVATTHLPLPYWSLSGSLGEFSVAGILPVGSAPQRGGSGIGDPREPSGPPSQHSLLPGSFWGLGAFFWAACIKHQMPSLTSSLGEGIFGRQNPQAVWESSRSLKVVGRRGSFFLTSPESQGSVPGQLWDYSCLVNKKQNKSLSWDCFSLSVKKEKGN